MGEVSAWRAADVSARSSCKTAAEEHGGRWGACWRGRAAQPGQEASLSLFHGAAADCHCLSGAAEAESYWGYFSGYSWKTGVTGFVTRQFLELIHNCSLFKK